MIIWGFRSSVALLATLVYVCDTCGNNAAHRLVKRVRKFTLFFIPLFPVGTKYLDTCTACGRVIEVPKEQAESAVTSQMGQGQQAA